MKPVDLRELARQHGKSQSQLGLSQPHVSLLMRGQVQAGPNAITKIATALGVEPPVVYAACQESVRRASAVQIHGKRRAGVARKAR